MITWFLRKRLTRLGTRPIADASIKASIRESLVQAGYLKGHAPWLVRTRAVLATSGIFIVGLGGMTSYAYASDAVLPNTPLYPVREQLEAIELKLAPTAAAKVQVEVRQKEKRVQEAKALISQHKKLPALHAKIMAEEAKEQREERHRKQQEAATTTTTLRLLPRIRLEEQRSPEAKKKEKKDAVEEKVKEGRRSGTLDPIFLRPTSTKTRLEDERATSSRRLRTILPELEIKAPDRDSRNRREGSR